MATERCSHSFCGNASKYTEMARVRNRETQQIEEVPTLFCGVHAPSRVAARKDAKSVRQAQQRLADLTEKASRTEVTGAHGWGVSQVVASGTMAGDTLSFTVEGLGEFSATGADEIDALYCRLDAAKEAARGGIIISRARADLAAAEAKAVAS